MITLSRNKQNMKYALYIDDTPIYETDHDGNVEYTEIDGENVPIDTGESEATYSDAVSFRCSLSMSGSEAEAKEYGLSVADYEATIVYPNDTIPLQEGSLIWYKSIVKNRYTSPISVNTPSGIITTHSPINTSADYTVIKISKSLNFTKAVLKAVNK